MTDVEASTQGEGLELGPGLRPGVFPYETPGGRFGFYLERGLLRLLGGVAFPSVSIVPELCAMEGLSGEAEFLARYESSKEGIQELWGSRDRQTPAAVEGFYDEHDADLWRQAYRSRFVPSYRAKLLLQARIVERLARGDRQARILDYGCGAGVLTHRLLNRGYRVVNVADVSSPTLRFCQAAFGERIACYHEVGSLRPLQGEYDVIACLDCLEHTVDPERIAAELIDHLAPGGGLVISYPLETDFSFSHTREAAAARPAVMRMLSGALEIVLDERVYRKPSVSRG